MKLETFAIVCAISLATGEQIRFDSNEIPYGMGLLRRENDPNGIRSRAVASKLASSYKQLRNLAANKYAYTSGLSESVKDELNLINRLPAQFDLRDHGFVTSVKNQRRCGSCVSFATMATVESSYHLQMGKPVTSNKELDLSESSLYACSKRVECDPGGMYLDDAAEILERIGVQEESSLPYNSTNLQCNRVNSRFMPFALKTTFLPTVARVQQWMRNKGAVLTAFEVPSNFMNVLRANHGVYDYEGDLEFVGGHAVSCIGYDNTYRNAKGEIVGAWICKNSWGTDFGSDWNDKGYFRVAFGQLGLMAESYGVEIKENLCTYGHHAIEDKYPITNPKYPYDPVMDACDAARLANERELSYWGIDAKDYLVQGLTAYQTDIDCTSSTLDGENDLEIDIRARGGGKRLFGASVEQIYSNIGCKIIDQ